MCGIAGGIYPQLKQEDIDKTICSLSHRGPDDSGYYKQGDLFFSHTRLAIQDLSQQAHQPILSTDGNYILVYNGELYNQEFLKNLLLEKNIPFNNSSDSQLLLTLLITFGEQILPQLNGIFSFAFYNKIKNEILIVRDAMGVKPLYYYFDKNIFLFASELKALQHFENLDFKLNPEALQHYITLLFAPQEYTPYQIFKKLLPSHFMKFDLNTNQLEIKKYTPNNNPLIEKINKSEQEWIDKLEILLLDTIKRQMNADVPIGFFLSGGLDSSVIVAMARKIYPEKEMHCFTIDTKKEMQKEGFEDDLYFAKKAAQFLNVTLNIIECPKFTDQEFDAMIWSLDEPQADLAPINVQKIAAAAQLKGIKVLLSGAGADDIFSGYRRHQLIPILPYLNKFTFPLISIFGNIFKRFVSLKYSRRIEKILAIKGGNKIEKMDSLFFWTSPEKAKKLMLLPTQKNFKINDTFSKILAQYPTGIAPLNQLLLRERHSFLPDHNLNYTDKLSMQNGVETRVPFLDNELIAFADSLPDSMKMKGKTTKYILRKLAEKYLPLEIINRSKTGFGVPLRSWVAENNSTLIKDKLLNPYSKIGQYFKPTEIEKIIINSKKEDNAYTILSLLAMESWLRQFKNNS